MAEELAAANAAYTRWTAEWPKDDGAPTYVAFLAGWQARADHDDERLAADDSEMCPNCVTPWKCNGPHVPWPPQPTETGADTEGAL